MYYVSDELTNALRDTAYMEVYGTVTTKKGVTYMINDHTLAQGSLEVTRECVPESSFQLGTAISSELSFGLILDSSRYDFYDAQVTVGVNVHYNGKVAPIPLGVYNIAEANRGKNSLSFIAYDNMLKLDKPYESKTISGTTYEVASFLVEQCGLELALSNFNNFINYDMQVGFDAESGFNTYRDALCAVAQVLGTFIQCTRDGRITFVQYATSETVSINEGQRYSMNLEDYVCEYIGVVVNNKEKSFSAMSTKREYGQVFYYDDAPGWDYGTQDKLNAMTKNLMELLDNYEYTPGVISVFSDPTLEPGDNISLVTKGTKITTLLTRVQWSYRSATTLESVGTNPYFEDAGESHTSSRNQVASAKSKVIYHTFSNAGKITLSDEYKDIGKVVIAPTEPTDVIMHTMVNIDCVVEDEKRTLTIDDKEVEYTVPNSAQLFFRYKYDGSILPESEVVDTVGTGLNLESLTYHFGIDNTMRKEIVLQSKYNGKSATIEKGKVDGIISGQGIEKQEDWNGIIEINETYSGILIRGNIGVHLKDDSVQISTIKPIGASFTENVHTSIRGRVKINLEDTMNLTVHALEFKRASENGIIRVTENGIYRGNE